LNVVRDVEGMNVARRLKGVAALGGPPGVLEIVPATTEDNSVNRPGVAVTRQDAGLPHAENVDEVTLGGAEAQGPEVNARALWHP
jgi:hypothetical protein